MMKVDMRMDDALTLRVTLLAQIEKSEVLLDLGWMTDGVRVQTKQEIQSLSDLLDRLDMAIDGDFAYQKMMVAPTTEFIHHCQEFVH